MFYIMDKPIIIQLLLFGLASAQILPNGCPSDFSVHLLLQHETDCDKFYSCSNGNQILMSCPPTLLFDFDLQVCNHAILVNCQPSTTTDESTVTDEATTEPATLESVTVTTESVTETTESVTVTTESVEVTTESVDATTDVEYLHNGCPSDSHIHYLIPHETDCHKFYQCAHGKRVLFECAHPTLFDAKLKVCNWAHSVTCRVNTPETTPDTADATTENLDTTTEEQQTDNDTATDDSETEAAETQETSTVAVAKPSTEATEFTTPVRSTSSETDEFATTESTLKPLLPSVCPDGFIGSVPHPELCDSYYVCTGWEPIQLFCRQEWEFDPVLQTCIELAEGGCTWQQMSPTDYQSTTTSKLEDLTTQEYSTDDSTTITMTATESTVEDTTTNEIITEKSTTLYTTEEATTNELTTTESAENDLNTTGYTTETTVLDETTKTVLTTPEPTTEDSNTSESATTESITEKTTQIDLTVSTTDLQTTKDDWETTESYTTLPICPDGFYGNLPHPERCDAYYLCSGWTPILLFCPTEFEFDVQSQTCVAIAEGGCTWYQTSTTTITDATGESSTGTESSTAEDVTDSTLHFTDTTTPEVITVDTTLSDATTEESTSSVVTEITTQEITPDDLTTTPVVITEETAIPIAEHTTLISTTDESAATFTTEISTKPESITSESTLPGSPTDNWEITTVKDKLTTEDYTTTVLPEVESKPPPICPEGFFGNVAHPERCDAYYLCSGWNPILLFCSQEFEFDSNVQVCVAIAEGGCTWNQTSTTTITEYTTETSSESESTTNSEPVVTGSDITEITPDLSTVATTDQEEDKDKTSVTDTQEQDTTEQFTTDYVTTEKETTEQATTEEVTTEQETTEQATTEQEATEQASTELQTTEQVTTEQAITEPVTTEKATTEQITTEHATIENETTEQDITEQATTEHDTTKELTTPETTESTTVESIAPVKCPDGFFGNVPHADLCNAYYLCSGWNPILLYCPQGQEFDPESAICVAIAEGGCTWQQTISTEAVTTEITTTEVSSSSIVDGDLTLENNTEENVTEDLATEQSTADTTITEEITSTTYIDEESTSTEDLTVELTTTDKTEATLEPDTVTESITTTSEPVTTESDEPATQTELTTAAPTTTDTNWETTIGVSTTTEESETTADIEVTTPVLCPDGYFGMIANSEECDAYYMCSGWIPIPLRCPIGYEFDLDFGECVEIAKGGCTWLSTSTIQPSTESSTSELLTSDLELTIGPVTIEVNTDAQTTSDVPDTTMIYSTLDDNSFLPPNPGPVNPDNQVETTAEPTTDESVEPTTEELIETTEEIEITTPAICPDGFFGMVANAEECDAYYMCSGWMPISLRCPSGFEFNPESESCELIDEGGCNLNQKKSLADAMTSNINTVEEKINENNTDLNKPIDADQNTNEYELKSDKKSKASDNEVYICPESFNGYTAKPRSCNTFYKCLNGVSTEIMCTFGMEFDPKIEKCVPISDYGCTRRVNND